MLPSDLTPSFPFSLAFFNEDETLYAAGDLTSTFPLASVTKILAGRAILIAVEEGFINLDEERLIGYPSESTSLRALLAHVSGVSFNSADRVAAVGQRRTYTNYAFEVAGAWVAERVGLPFTDWLDESVVAPLLLQDTFVEGSCAYSGIGSARDLITLGRELLEPKLISAELALQACTVQWPGIRGVTPGYGSYADNTWGLGLELRGDKQVTWFPTISEGGTFGHFGQSGSFLWVAPESRFGAVFVGAEPFGNWHKQHWSRLNDWLIESFI